MILRGKSLQVGDSRKVDLFRAKKSPHSFQSSGVCLGTMCMGDDQLLDKG